MTNPDIPFVSVVMPNYNGEDFIGQSISSVLAQTYSNWELIICDDCSTDSSLDLIAGFKDSRIRPPLRLETNQGAAVARNKAIEEAKGEFIAFLDNDDYWSSEKLEKQLNFMLRNGYDFTYTDYFQFTNSDSKRIKCRKLVNYKALLKNNYVLTSTVIYNAGNLGKIYMQNIRKRQDWSLFINIVKQSQYGYNLPIPLTYYRRHENSLSANKRTLLKYNFDFYHRVLGFSKVASFLLMLRFLFYYFLKKIMERL